MDQLVCRDCGLELPADARGCSRCALNFEAEKMIGRLVWLRIVPALILSAVVVAAAIVYLSR